MQNDTVNHPSHYTSGNVECIDALKAATVGLEGIEAVCTANAIKYLWRWKRKNGVEDLKKAIWYIQRLIAEQMGQSDSETAKIAMSDYTKQMMCTEISKRYTGEKTKPYQQYGG